MALISRFALVGIASTLIYALIASGLGVLYGAASNQATLSFLSYAVAAAFSYSAHRYFTFASNGAYRLEIPRFVVVTITGAAISYALPLVAESWLKLPMSASILGVCIVIPAVNFIALNRWVFGDRHSSPEGE